MEKFDRLVKKYFILLLILLPLRKMGVFFIMVFGQEMMLEHFGSFEEYQLGYVNLLDQIELINVYAINVIISLIIVVDLKPTKKSFGIPILTALLPVVGVTFFMIQQFYLKNLKAIKIL